MQPQPTLEVLRQLPAFEQAEDPTLLDDGVGKPRKLESLQHSAGVVYNQRRPGLPFSARAAV